jgi:endonuclease YncB( thermonuclease family)
MKSFIISLSLALLLLSCSSSTDSSKDCQCTNPFVDSIAIVTCVSVSDGDTWKFELKDERFSVRVLYVDCFETRRGSRLDDQAEAAGISPDSALALGKLGKHLADSLMSGNKVTMMRDYEADNLDVYGRLLRITVVNGIRLDSLMVEKGYGVGI